MLIPNSAFADLIYSAPGYSGSALGKQLMYALSVDTANAGAGKYSYTDPLTRDGSSIVLYFKSSGLSSNHSFCISYTYFKVSGGTGSRYGCYNWFDQTPHSVTLLSHAEAMKIGTFVLHYYDVKGTPTWDGEGDPPNILYHFAKSYKFTGGTTGSTSSGSSATGSPQTPSLADQAKALANSVAKTVFFAAWPTAKYKSYSFTGVSIKSGVGAEVTFRLTGTSSWTGGEIWVDVVMTVSKQLKVTDLRWGDYQAFIKPGSTLKLVEELSK